MSSPSSENEQQHNVLRNLIHPRVLKWVISAFILAIALLVICRMYLANTRFYIIQTSEGIVYEIDRQTGRTWRIYGGTKTEAKDPSDPAHSRALPTHLHSKISLHIESIYSGVARGTIYNGCDWAVNEVELRLTFKPKDDERWTRNFRIAKSIEPYTSASIYFSTGDNRRSGGFFWTITQVRGSPPNRE